MTHCYLSWMIFCDHMLKMTNMDSIKVGYYISEGIIFSFYFNFNSKNISFSL